MSTKLTLIQRSAVATGVLLALFLTFIFIQPVSAGHNSDGLVGYWNLNEGSGTDAFDTSTHSYDGTVNGATWAGGPPIIDNTAALSFDGDDDHVEVPAPGFLSDTEGSISAWFRLDDPTVDAPKVIVSASVDGSTDDELLLQWQGNAGDVVRLALLQNGAVTLRLDGDTAVNDFSWHHVAVTSDGSDITMYVDGVEQTLTETTGSNNGQWFADAADADTFAIGGVLRASLQGDFDGGIDEVRVYDRALSEAEVSALEYYGNFTISLDPETAINVPGTEHSVTATIDPALAGIPVLVHVNGPNATTTYPEYLYTDGNGEVSFTYQGDNEGEDTIWTCVDVSYNITGGGVCNVPEYAGEPYATAVKSWIAAHFVTGGGTIKSENGKKPAWNFGGNVGIGSDGETMGQLQLNKHSGPKDTCHYDTFSNISYSGDPTESPTAEVRTIMFTAEGECQKGGPSTIDVTMTDNDEPGKGADVFVASSTSGDTEIDVDSVIDGGNIQMHPPEVLVGADLASYEPPALADCDVVVDDDGGADFTSIQGAIDDAGTNDGDTVCVADGVYDEFVVDKGLTIAGLSNPGDGSAKVTPSSGAVTDIVLVSSNQVTITGLLIDGDGTDLTGNQAAGIRISPSGANVDNVHVTYNVIRDLAAVSGTASNKGIQWHTEAGSGYSLRDSSFTHNVIDNITSASKGGYGIQTVGDMDDVMIGNNTISNIDGAWGAGIALDSLDEVDTSGVSVAGNHIMDGIWTPALPGAFPVSVQVEHKVDQTGIMVNQNNIEGLLHGGGAAGAASGPDVDAENNWWGDDDPSDDVFGPVDFDPWADEAFELN